MLSLGHIFRKAQTIMEVTMEAATKKQLVLSLLAAGSLMEKVVNSIGVHRATIRSWKKDPKLVAEWNKMLEEIKQGRLLLEVH